MWDLGWSSLSMTCINLWAKSLVSQSVKPIIIFLLSQSVDGKFVFFKTLLVINDRNSEAQLKPV